MGNCFGSCLPNSQSKSLCETNSSIDFNLLIEDNSTIFQNCKKRNFFERLLLRGKSHKKIKVQKPMLELVDGIFSPQISSYSRLNEFHKLPSTSSCNNSKDIPLQCLDARALLRTTASTPTSLDLEWEHETLLPSSSMVTSGSSWTALPEDLPTDSSTHNAECSDSFSRVSSANSLEWDNAQQQFLPSPEVSEMDSDTQVLLKEIERLTNQTLEETGKELYS